MFRIVKWSLFFIVLGVSGVILNSSSPKISIEVADIRFESTLFILIAVLLLAIGVLYILVSGLYKFFLLPLNIRKCRLDKLKEDQFQNLVDFFLYRDKSEVNSSRKVLDFLIRTSIPPYVKDWLMYKFDHDTSEDSLKSIETLLKYPQTAKIATISLIEREIKFGYYSKALAALKSLDNSYDDWSTRRICYVYAIENQWGQLLEYIKSSNLSNNCKKDLCNLCNYKIAEDYFMKKMYRAVHEQSALLTNYHPAIFLSALSYIAIKKNEEALKLITKNLAKYPYYFVVASIIFLKQSSGAHNQSELTALLLAKLDQDTEYYFILDSYTYLLQGNYQLNSELANIEELVTYSDFFDQYCKEIVSFNNNSSLKLFTELLISKMGRRHKKQYYDFDTMRYSYDKASFTIIVESNLILDCCTLFG